MHSHVLSLEGDETSQQRTIWGPLRICPLFRRCCEKGDLNYNLNACVGGFVRGYLKVFICIAAKDLIEKLLKTEPKLRLDIDGILRHPWIYVSAGKVWVLEVFEPPHPGGPPWRCVPALECCEQAFTDWRGVKIVKIVHLGVPPASQTLTSHPHSLTDLYLQGVCVCVCAANEVADVPPQKSHHNCKSSSLTHCFYS